MPNNIKKAANDRTALIGGIISIIENKLGAAQDDLFKKLISDLVDSLDRDGDQIKNTLRNKRMISLVDSVFTDYAKGKGLEVAASVIKGVSQVMDFNGKYFAAFTEPAKLGPIHDVVKGNLTDWLGISKTGKVEVNGYLDTLINDPNIKNQVKDLTVKSVFNQAGYQETKKNLSDFITGNEETGGVGALKKYYRNFVYDTFSQVDRTNGKLYADKLQLNYAIYEGGLVEKSRIFCKEHNGKVFTREEIADFDPPEAKPPGYNPFFDLGGYGCRHHLNWVPDAVAFALRPDLRNAPPAVKPVDKPKQEPKPTPPPTVKPKPAIKPAPPQAPPPPRLPVNPVKGYDFTKKPDAANEAAKLIEENLGFTVEKVGVAPELTVENLNKRLDKIKELVKEYGTTTALIKGRPLKVSFTSTENNNGYINYTNVSRQQINEINFGHRVDTESRRQSIKTAGLRFKSRVDIGNEEIATTTHEFAHIISTHQQQMLDRDPRLNEFWPELRTLMAQYTRELKDILGKSNNEAALNEFYLGQYASTNPNEFMAEAFTEYKLSSNPSPYAVKVGKLIDKYFKKKK